jgi:hypothetical protein
MAAGMKRHLLRLARLQRQRRRVLLFAGRKAADSYAARDRTRHRPVDPIRAAAARSLTTEQLLVLMAPDVTDFDVVDIPPLTLRALRAPDTLTADERAAVLAA